MYMFILNQRAAGVYIQIYIQICFGLHIYYAFDVYSSTVSNAHRVSLFAEVVQVVVTAAN